MPSTLTWIDHDSAARERSLRILSLFQERESRDELGLGGIRDSFSDLLFPGTSTIQTRLRYMLFIPWVYNQLEKRRVSPGEFGAIADRAERALIAPLLESDDLSGVFGRTAGKGVKRLPSSVYWAGLRSWGIRQVDASQDEYHRKIGIVYRKRSEQSERDRERVKNGDDNECTPLPGTLTWHPRIPEPPADFPETVDFNLSHEEASFLLDRIQRSHPKSLLAHLALNCKPAEIDFPWQHPDYADFKPEHKEVLEHAQHFSELMHGAALIYNIALTKLKGFEEKTELYEKAFDAWMTSLSLDDVRSWSLESMWDITIGQGHTITPATRHFVERWYQLITTSPQKLYNKPAAIDLIQRREKSLKKNRSRFVNHRALEQWTGTSGLGHMSYRWSTTKNFLNDLYGGLCKGEGLC